MRRLFVLVVMMAGAACAGATTYTVLPDGSGDFPTIQAAVDAAEDGDVVELTDGIFTGEGNRMIDFLGKAIAIRSQSGDPERTVIDADAGRILLFQSGEGPGTVVVDITMQHGSWFADEFGGGAAYCGPGSAPTFVNCIFRENSCEPPGGAIVCHGASPTVSDCVFGDNRTYFNGGAIFCSDGASPTITGCLFDDNDAGYEGNGGSGGAVYSTRDCELTITDCEFFGNWAEGAGGAVSCSGTLAGCTIAGNSASSGGGVSGHDLTINGCLLRGNWAADRGRGGAVSCWSSLAMTNSTLYHNWATSRASGINCEPGSWAVVENCIIAFGVEEEAVACEGATATLRCCDVYGNEGGDWVGCIADQLGQDGNICEDPLFCSRESCPPDLRLQDCSPCRPFPPENPECDLIGALPVACQGSPSRATTWGGVKALFRQ